MNRCPECGRRLGRHMEDEWAECACGWGELHPAQCASCLEFFPADGIEDGVCEDCRAEAELLAEDTPGGSGPEGTT
jgi:hypothetical protein